MIPGNTVYITNITPVLKGINNSSGLNMNKMNTFINALTKEC